MHPHCDAFAALVWTLRQACGAFQCASRVLHSHIPATTLKQQKKLYLILPQLKSEGLVGYLGVPSPIDRVEENSYKPSFYMCQLVDRINMQRDSLISDMPKPSDDCGFLHHMALSLDKIVP